MRIIFADGGDRYDWWGLCCLEGAGGADGEYKSALRRCLEWTTASSVGQRRVQMDCEHQSDPQDSMECIAHRSSVGLTQSTLLTPTTYNETESGAVGGDRGEGWVKPSKCYENLSERIHKLSKSKVDDPDP